MSEKADGCFSFLRKPPKGGKLDPRLTVAANDPWYNMNHPERGICLIINQVNSTVPEFVNRPRLGSDLDRDSLKKMFDTLGFSVRVPPNDLTKVQTMIKIREVAEMDHRNRDCFVLCFLGHGKEGCIFASDGDINYKDIFSLFTAEKCGSLATKPKLFFFQACQGQKVDDGVKVTRLEGGQMSGPISSYKIPIEEGFLVAYSSVPGYISWIENGKGSWFIQSLVAELENHWQTLDLASIMTHVCRRVAIEYTDQAFYTKQMPFWTSTLTKYVKFSSIDPNLPPTDDKETEGMQ